MQATFANDLYAGRQVLVVGGTSGIGAGIAAGFVQCGARVLVTGATDADVDAAAPAVAGYVAKRRGR